MAVAVQWKEMCPTAGGSRAVVGEVVEDKSMAAAQEDLRGNQPVLELDRACTAFRNHIHKGYTPSASENT